MTNVASPPTTISKFAPTKRLNKRQRLFIEYWLDVNSPTFGNTYQSGIKAGFSDYSARVLTAQSHNIEWIQEAKLYLDRFTPEHIISAIQHLAHHAAQDRDRLNSLALLTKVKGMQQDHKTEVNIAFVNSVPRPVIDVSDGSHNTTDSPPITP